jgi:hypothetical protein
VADTRTCEQCGAAFAPRREHARFCSARCRVDWNREMASDQSAEMSPLDWAATAMKDAMRQLSSVRVRDPEGVLAVISEAVWRVTIVDATLVRYHPAAYDSALGRRASAERRLTEDTLAGLRFVRNQMGHTVQGADFICPQPADTEPDKGGITGWTWTSLPEPALAPLPPRGRVWELTRYRAYEAQLAGHPVGETFAQAEAFLTRALAEAAPSRA